MKYYKYLVIGLIVLALQIGVLSNLSLTYEISILPAVVFLLAMLAPLEAALIFSVGVGFMFDISTLQRIPFLTLFMLLETVFLFIAKKYVLNLSNFFGRIIALFVVVCAYQLLRSMIFYQGFSLGLVVATLANFGLAVLTFEFIYIYRKKFFNL